VDASRHVADQDFSAVIARALELPGFTAKDIAAMPPKPPHMVGFGHTSTLSVAGAVIDAIKAGKLEHIFLVGGCDGNGTPSSSTSACVQI
jgi:hydroxylamine reductase